MRRKGHGIAIALAIILLWASHLAYALGEGMAGLGITGTLLAVIVQTFLSTGLFITAHDAMHGTVAPGHRRLNDLLGTIAIGLYALFSYRKLHRKHWEHHAHPGIPGEDPDFHDGEHPGFFRWYAHFVWGYVGIWQIVGMAIVFNVLSHGVGLPEPDLFVLWVAPALLSTFQLFYFGTYLPHREPHAADDEHRARSNEYPAWLSFLTCYHFGYHREHHESPGTPWWRLPAKRSELASRDRSFG